MKSFVKNEMVFVIAFLAAAVSALFNPPSEQWVESIDFRTLALLFSLMGISEGLKASGFFNSIAVSMQRRAKNTREISISLTFIVFISSMFFTNDVSLLMFVPFSMMLLSKAGADEKTVIKLVVLETISANLGSMTTPVGNPQNLYICSFFNVGASPFFKAILPYSILSAILIAILSLISFPAKHEIRHDDNSATSIDRPKTLLYLIFLLLALLSVFRLLDWRVLFFLELAVIIVFDRAILKKIDYILLLTFICFFIFSGNMKEIEGVRALLTGPMQNHPIAVSALVSQIISNVPATILLAPFSPDFKGVLIGTDIGGLGTPIASLASLISLKFYFKREEGNRKSYMMVFLLWNFILLFILAVSSLLIN